MGESEKIWWKGISGGKVMGVFWGLERGGGRDIGTGNTPLMRHC